MSAALAPYVVFILVTIAWVVYDCYCIRRGLTWF